MLRHLGIELHFRQDLGRFFWQCMSVVAEEP